MRTLGTHEKKLFCSVFVRKGIVSLVVTDDEAALRERLGSTEDSLGANGVMAILLSRGYGTTRIWTELQQAWLLGYADVCIVTPVSDDSGA